MKIVNRITSNKNHFGFGNPCNYITIHQTGNESYGADAMAHSNFMNNGSAVTWHYTVDDKRIVKHLDDRIRGWHSGDGRGRGNMESIGIEMCVNVDGDYKKALKNLVQLVSYLQKIHGIPNHNVVQHNFWTGKNCPQQIRQGYQGVNWNSFMNMVKGSTVNHVVEPTNKNVTEKGVDYNELARLTILGKFGNGATRIANLGKHYNEVQKRVNELLK